jgi:tRNA(Met) cytidine acetyltransferase
LPPTPPASPDRLLRTDETRDLQRLADDLRCRARAANHRLTLLLSGSATWTLSAAEAAISNQTGARPVWLSNRPLGRASLPLTAAQGLLGSEIEILIYDAHGGFDPDGFGAAVGALRGGGLLLLLTPPPALWPQLPDPQAARVAVFPFSAEQVAGRFVRRFQQCLTSAPGVTLVQEGSAIPAPHPAGRPKATPSPRQEDWGDCRSRDQAEAVAAVLRAARTRAHRPLVITSDRGRGKSSALGIAAARLLAAGGHQVVATAPRRAAVEPLMRHAARLLPGAEVHTNHLRYRDGSLAFRPPDAVCLAPDHADLLLVDEAAGIPATLLEHMLRTYPRLVFATTIHGYEGTGRGFEIRFRRTLDELAPSWTARELRTPIRWAANDPLESLSARALLLDATPAANEELADARPPNCRHRRLDREALGQDPACLNQLFGLLVLAHYQTRPLDLRHLLDGPNIRVHAITHNDKIAATALVALEGGLDAGISRRIFEGTRRPRGHLLPQTLCAHAGAPNAPRLRYARIVRIAVHPAVRGRGLGRKMLDGIAEGVRGEGLDLLGASFGVTEDLLRFWTQCGYRPVHLGTKRNAASGAHAVVMLSPMTAAGDELHKGLRFRLAERMPALLAAPLRDLDPLIAAALLGASPPATGTGEDRTEQKELDAFAFAQRPYEAALPVIDKLLRARLREAFAGPLLTEKHKTALVAKVLQHRSWADAAFLVGARGRAEVVSLLRQALGRLIARCGPHV